jgi:ATP-binding cassette subfamily B protein
MQSNSKKSSFNFSLLGRVLLFVKPYRAVFYGSILLAILMAFFAPVRPYLIQLTVDEVTGKHPHIPQWVHWFTGNIALQSFTGLIIAITIFQIIFLLIETIVRFIFTFLTAWLGQHVVKDLRVTVYNKILHLNLTQFDKTPIGTLTTRTINDIESINDIFSDGLIPILADLLTILITLATMFWIDWRLTLVALIPFPILIIATYYFKEAVNKSFIRVRNAVVEAHGKEWKMFYSKLLLHFTEKNIFPPDILLALQKSIRNPCFKCFCTRTYYRHASSSIVCS